MIISGFRREVDENFVRNYYYYLRNDPEERSSHFLYRLAYVVFLIR
jgi:hypothetical protein